MLRDRFRPIVQTAWQGEACDALIALHARRSAESIARFHAEARGRRMAVVLTGTDLYQDLPGNVEAAASLDMADRIVVLQDDALRLLRARWRRKAEVIFQSASLLARRAKPGGRLDCVVVGHLREEKDPRTLFDAVARLEPGLAIRVRHIGAPIDPALGALARDLARRDRRYRYAGALPHGLTRAAIRSAHLLVHPSVVEGGANVIVEAITAGTPVLASRISGNIGMLGRGYPGFFEPRDGAGLAARLARALEDPRELACLRSACEERKPLFRPRAEASAIAGLAAALVAQR
jgi:putative glycosyltransferase (TIGR04348 family)